MKNVIYGLCSTMLLTLFCLLPSPSFADECEDESMVQVIKACHVILGTGFNGPACPINSLPIEIDEQTGEASVIARVYTTHLIPSGTFGGGYILPIGTREIYMRLIYDVNYSSHTTTIGPFNTFLFDANYQPTTDPLYNSDIPVTLDFSSFLCKELEEGQLILSNLKMELLAPIKAVPGTYELYPIHDYSSPGDVFACSTFEETCYDCSNPNCTELLPPVYEEQLCFDCKGVETQEGPGGELKRQRAPKLVQQGDWESKLNPNPFDQELNLQIRSPKELNLDIEIYSATGQLVQAQQTTLGVGGGQETINTAALAPGIYYFHIKDGQKTVTHKLVKLD